MSARDRSSTGCAQFGVEPAEVAERLHPESPSETWRVFTSSFFDELAGPAGGTRLHPDSPSEAWRAFVFSVYENLAQ